MGDPHSALVDAAAIDGIAARFDNATALIERSARVRFVFDGASAGRAHIAGGDEVRRALDALLADLNLWARATAEIAAALRAGARRYREADLTASAGIS